MGITIRNISICCVWLLCFARIGLFAKREVYTIVDFFLLIISILVTMFCSVSVLRVLVRTGPGEKAREWVDQSKKKSFYTLVIILSVLLLRFVSSMVWTALFLSMVNKECLILACLNWCNLPSSLVLPLLFLHKGGRFNCLKKLIK
ncbi:hypothetical protein ATANTOWER_010146 [Ataeniobius toweri]|uniref:Vomeronasal type-1 receptor n=1 Tax=Ataeniobius toweri TaxID=208326 RepID=A0ABU7BPQ4_9TELE|nr:hypothetical protein [Ataeniobius toweri]